MRSSTLKTSAETLILASTFKSFRSTDSQIKPVYGDIEVHTVFDGEGDHYQVVRSGWNKSRRVYGSLIHMDLKGDKIWIQYDGTEVGVANELVDY